MRATLFLILAIIFAFFVACDNNKVVNQKLSQKIDILQVQNDSLKKVLDLRNAESEVKLADSPEWYYPETDSRELLDSGIEDPEAYIQNALREKTDLIPMDAVLGGTMHYNNIQLLGNNWLIADFEDGHVYGKALFEYKISNRNKLNFKIIALNEQ